MASRAREIALLEQRLQQHQRSIAVANTSVTDTLPSFAPAVAARTQRMEAAALREAESETESQSVNDDGAGSEADGLADRAASWYIPRLGQQTRMAASL